MIFNENTLKLSTKQNMFLKIVKKKIIQRERKKKKESTCTLSSKESR